MILIKFQSDNNNCFNELKYKLESLQLLFNCKNEDELKVIWKEISTLLSPNVIINSSPLSLLDLDKNNIGLLIDGDILLQIFGNEMMELLLFNLTQNCKTVLACRLSPEQKRLIVKLVKTRL
jgi:magnesium-transporting ATPase (P-type)